MLETITIAIDHGNRYMKTINHVFPSSYVASSNLPVTGANTLQYNSIEYALNDKCLPQLSDKTVDERYFILTLFAIGMELASNPRLQKPFATDEILFIELLIGLPLQLFREFKDKFRAYFSNRGEITFTLNKRTYSIKIADVYAYPQGYAAFIASRSQLIGSKVFNVIDIGGYTIDCLQVIDNMPIIELCTSLETGVNTLFHTINDRVRAKAKRPIPEKIIESILQRDPAVLAERRNQVDLVMECAGAHASHLLSEISQKNFDLDEDKTVFVGGGSILLRQKILDAGVVKKPVFINNVHANVEGFLAIRDMEKRAIRA